MTTTYRYDPAGRVAATRTGAEGERQVGYDEMSRPVLETDGDEGIWRSRHDAWGRLFHENLPTGAVVRRRFDRAHQPVESQVFSADPLTVPDARLLSHTRTEVTSFGAVERVIEELTEDGERRITERQFDASGRVIAVVSGPEGEPGRVDPAQARRELAISYEAVTGRVLAQSTGGAPGEPPQAETRFEYSAEAAIPWPLRQVERESVPGQPELVTTVTTAFEHDVLGRVLATSTSSGERRTMTYDRGSADLLRTRTGAGAEEAVSRDGRGLPVFVSRPTGRGADRFAYDLDGLPLGQVTTAEDGTPLWQTSWTYDATGRIAAIDYADGTREERTYHPDSTLATVLGRDGVTLAFTYDAANRPTRIVPTAGPGPTLIDAGDQLAYDELSRPKSLTRGRPGLAGFDPALAVAYPAYDLASRPLAEVVGERPPLTWTYDTWGRRTSVELPAGPGRDPAATLRGFTRSFDTLDRLTSTAGLGAAGLSVTPLGADWAWGGSSRLYGFTTRGTLGTAMRYGYHGGAGPQVPGLAPEASSEWKLGRLTWGAAGAAGPTEAPATGWGDFAYGWRGHEGSPSDGAKIGRLALPGSADAGLLTGLGWSWAYDAGMRLTEATAGTGDLEGSAPPPAATAERFTFTYGPGDQLESTLRAATGEVDLYTSGPYGRPLSRDGHAFTYDAVGRRLEDDRFVYRWDWRGRLVSVEVKPTWPDANGDGEPEISPYAGHHLRYDYDALGRLTRRLHEGEAASDGSRPFVEGRRFVWEGDRLAAEAAYGAPETGVLRWRKTYVPGPTGLDDPVQVIVEANGTARTYTYVTDELGTVVALVAEDEGTDPAHPPVPVRYRYTPYGEAHAETGPELLRARFEDQVVEVATAAGTVTQTVADPALAAPGAMVITWSLPLDPETDDEHLVVEQLLPGSGWTAVGEGEVAVGERASSGLGTGADDAGEVVVLATSGWQRGRSYRLRLGPSLTDRLGRLFGRSEMIEWRVPAAIDGQPPSPVSYDQRFPIRYESWQAAGVTLGGRFPGGQGRLFQGLWTDPVTGTSYARARWYDARNAVWLVEDPLVDVDSANLYAFVGLQPTMARDPRGEAVETLWDIASLTLGLVSLRHNLDEGDLGAAALDAFGVVVDAAATLIPFVPGGAGAAIKGARAVSAVRKAQLVDQMSNVAQGAVQAAEAFGEGDTLTAAFYGGMSALGVRGVMASPYRLEVSGIGANVGNTRIAEKALGRTAGDGVYFDARVGRFRDGRGRFVPRAAAGAESAVNARLLAQQLTRQEASSVFTSGGALHPEVLARSRPIIPGSQIRNQAVVRELTADGSNIADWAKYSTETFQSPSGAFQVHFYQNARTGAVNYAIDYKAVFNRGVQ